MDGNDLVKIVQLDVLAGGGSNGEKKSYKETMRDRQTDSFQNLSPNLMRLKNLFILVSKHCSNRRIPAFKPAP